MAMSEYIRALREKIGNKVLEVPTAAAIVLDARGRVLLVRNAQGPWSTPGGMLEPHETPADAAVRETWEETGVLVRLTRLVGVFGGALCQVKYDNGDELAWVASVFEARPLCGEPRPDGDETAEVRYFAREEIAKLPLRPHMQLFLDAAFDTSGRAFFQPPTWMPQQTR